MDNSEEVKKDPRDYIKLTAEDDSSSSDDDEAGQVQSQDVRIMERSGSISVAPLWGSWKRVLAGDSFPSTTQLIETSMKYKKEQLEAQQAKKEKEALEYQRIGAARTLPVSPFPNNTPPADEKVKEVAGGDPPTGNTEEASASSEAACSESTTDKPYLPIYLRNLANSTPISNSSKRPRVEGCSPATVHNLKWQHVSNSTSPKSEETKTPVTTDHTRYNNNRASQPQILPHSHYQSRMFQAPHHHHNGLGYRRYSYQKNRYEFQNWYTRRQDLNRFNFHHSNSQGQNNHGGYGRNNRTGQNNRIQEQDNEESGERGASRTQGENNNFNNPRSRVNYRDQYHNRSGSAGNPTQKKMMNRSALAAKCTSGTKTSSARTCVNGAILIAAIVMSVVLSWWIGRNRFFQL